MGTSDLPRPHFYKLQILLVTLSADRTTTSSDIYVNTRYISRPLFSHARLPSLHFDRLRLQRFPSTVENLLNREFKNELASLFLLNR